jgi:hypothetical protein
MNQEEKPVDVTGKDIIFRMISYDNTQILLEKLLTPALPVTGIMELQLLKEEIIDIDVQKCNYSLEIPVGSFDLPVYVNNDSAAKGIIDIVDGVMPMFVPARSVTTPTHPIPVLNNPVTYYSSAIETFGSSTITVQPYFTDFVGTIGIQGATSDINADWYDILTEESIEYTDPATGTAQISVVGFHPYVRLRVVSGAGDVTKILAR